MSRILVKSLAVGLISMLVSLAISAVFAPLMGGTLAGAGLVMTIACPLVISIPASFLHFYQADRVRAANLALAEAKEKLAVAYEMLQRQSRLDGLTGTLNRAAFMQELSARSRNGASGGLLFLDIDHFKEVNDRFGHATGDEALRLVGATLSDLSQEEDLVGRLGGEEFAIFLGDASPERMLEHSQTVRQAIESLHLRAPNANRVLLGASIGAFHCAPRFDPSEALAASDRNLYLAKSMGRNRVVA